MPCNWGMDIYSWLDCFILGGAWGCGGVYCVSRCSLPNNWSLAEEACLSKSPPFRSLSPIQLLLSCFSLFLALSVRALCSLVVRCSAFGCLRIHRALVPAMVRAATPPSALWFVIAYMQFSKRTTPLILGASMNIIPPWAWDLCVILCNGLGGFIKYAVWRGAQLLS